ncbi:DUF11 domain-containing protein [Lysinibacter cavernae]|uniref:Putative repeat protein (TIGR01451 family) n=1 Tax=Lysinibacter cavernae TaxID=1640652 RepID=A0A7X5R036_9MICO|nr:DUF11 domain-containing protein [Lysinibacter cavernae]NIH52970.1 putative repeat protein (TIGR01451 family) [Lysinibacter cavernae]
MNNRRRPIRAILGVSLSLLLGMSVAVTPAAAEPVAEASWQLQLTRQSPSPQASGNKHTFRLQVSCSAVAAPTCDDGVIRIPWPASLSQSAEHFESVKHPNVASWQFVNNELVVTMIKGVPAGNTTAVEFSTRSLNYVTPNNTVAELNATITGSNAEAVSASAEVTLTAVGVLGVKKDNPGNVPNGSALPNDLPLRYNIRVCDNSADELGRLQLVNAKLTDLLPPGAEFVAASGNGLYNGTDRVTWEIGELNTAKHCTDEQYWVELRYPSGSFGTGKSVVNTARVEGNFLGETQPQVRESAVNHTFGAFTPVGAFCKSTGAGRINVAGSCDSDIPAPVAIGQAQSNDTPMSWRLRTQNTSSLSASWSLRDPMPCATNTTLNEFGQNQYNSNAPGTICSDPAVRVTSLQVTSAAALTALADGQIYYLNTDGERKTFKKVSTYDWAIQADDILAELVVDNVTLESMNSFSFVDLTLNGYLPSDRVADETAMNTADFSLVYLDGSAITSSQSAVVRAQSGLIAQTNKFALSGQLSIGADIMYMDDLSKPWTGGVVVADLFPAGITANQLRVASVMPGSSNTATKYGPNDYSYEFIDNYNGTGRTLFRLTVAKGVPLYAAGKDSTVLSNRAPVVAKIVPANGASFPNLGDTENIVRISAANDASFDSCVFNQRELTVPLTDDSDDWNGNGRVDNESICSAGTRMTSGLQASPLLNAVKEVKGNLDSSFVGFPGVGVADPGQPGAIDYRMTITNGGSVAANDAVFYDVFPRIGDTGVSNSQQSIDRNSQWGPELAGAVSVPAGWTVQYSTATNPCRPEVGDGSATWPVGCNSDWSATLPANPSTVTAIKLKPAGPISMGDRAIVSWSMTSPAKTPTRGEIAWNSVAYSATRADDGLKLLTSEPPKVGIVVAQSDLSLLKTVSPISAAPGEEVTYSITVAHDAIPTVDPDTGEVSYLDRTTKNPTTAVAPGRDVVVEDQVPDGLSIVPGSSRVTIGSVDEATGRWDVGTVQAGESFTFTFRALVTKVGLITNKAAITANSVPDVDSPAGTCDEDTQDHCASVSLETAEPSITLLKQVNANGRWLDADAKADGSFDAAGEFATVASGAGVSYRFVVTNTGLSTLTNVQVTDPQIGEYCTLPTFTLAPGASRTLTCTWSTGWGIGDHVNTAGVVATTPSGATLTDSNTAQVRVPQPKLGLLKTTNGADASLPGDADVPTLTEFENVTWTYLITNEGQEPVRNVTLGDDVELDAVFACTLGSTGRAFTLGASGGTIPVGDSVTCTTSADAVSTENAAMYPDGVYKNTGRVTGQGTISRAGASSIDPSHYLGRALAPSIEVEKRTNGELATAAADAVLIGLGEDVTWTYVVTNTGDTPLVDLRLLDDVEGAVTCPVTSLLPGASTTCTLEATDGAVRDDYENTATVSGQPADDAGDPISGESRVDDQDVSHYFGAESEISLSKFTQEQAVSDPTSSGPFVENGVDVTWTYVVTNSGNTTLQNIAVSDDMEGAIVCPNTELAPLASMTCELTGTALPGQYRNTGSVSADGPEKSVSDDDPSAYFGSVPAIDLVKKVNGNAVTTLDDPEWILTGESATFEYTVTNIGNVALNGISLADDIEGAVNCPATSLGIGESMDCTLDAVAVAGPYVNVATATGAGPDTVTSGGSIVAGKTVQADDSAHYEAVTPELSVVKRTNGADANDLGDTDVPAIQRGSDVTWTFTVKNEGDSVLIGLRVSDDLEGLAVCPTTELKPGESTECTITGSADTLGDYVNLGSVSAQPADNDGNAIQLDAVTDEDPSRYYGAEPVVSLEKSVSPAVGVVAGDTVTYSFEVLNDGNTVLDKVRVEDPLPGLGDIVCNANGVELDPANISLAPGERVQCSAPYTITQEDALGDALINSAVAHAESVVGDVNSTIAEVILDIERPEIAVEKRTNGKLATEAFAADTPLLNDGDDVTWTYAVTNTGNVTLVGIVVEDNIEGVVSCPIDYLEPGESVTCEKQGTATVGAYENTATVTGASPTGNDATPASDSSRYMGTALPLPLAVTGGQLTSVLLLALGLLLAGGMLRRQRNERTLMGSATPR